VRYADHLTSVLKLAAGIIVMLALSACQLFNLNPGFSPDPDVELRIFGENPPSVPDVGLLALDEPLHAYLNQHVPAGLSGWDLVMRLQELLFSPEFLNIQYDDMANLNAAGVFREQRANCLSLVSLYIAMARHYNLDVRYQTVQVRPAWDRRGELLVLSEHINALGRLSGSDRYIVDFTPEIRLQRNTDKVIADDQALALFFNNLAVQYLLAGDLDTALEHSRYAVTVDPGLDLAWNNMGSVLSRIGELELAEYSYQKAAWLNRNNPSVINNLARFYAIQGDQERSREYSRAVESYNRRNPYYHYILGNIAYENENYNEALGHFRQAIRRNDLEPDFYMALGMTYRQLGDEEVAEQLAQLALAVRDLGDQTYRVSQNRVRRIDTRTILRSTSAGFSVEFVD
jgi:Flp pilus assembly protein TadD